MIKNMHNEDFWETEEKREEFRFKVLAVLIVLFIHICALVILIWTPAVIILLLGVDLLLGAMIGLNYLSGLIAKWKYKE